MKIILHSTASHGPNYLLNLLDQSIWLQTQVDQPASVEVILHPINASRLYLRFEECEDGKKSFWKFTEFFRRAWSKIRKNVKASEGESSANGQVTSFYDKIFRKHERVRFEAINGPIFLSLSERKLVRNNRDLEELKYEAERMWNFVSRKTSVDPLKFLQLEWEGVRIGDCIASHALRKFPKAGGSLDRCQGLWPMLVNGLAVCYYIERLDCDRECRNIITVPEPVYLHGIYRRLLVEKNKFPYLDPRSYNKGFTLSTDNGLLGPHTPGKSKSKDSLDQLEKEKVLSYLEKRCACPSSMLSYMSQADAASGQNIVNVNGASIDLVGTGTVVILFLHSFDDAQYFFGLDGFADLWEWTTFTIDHLLRNTDVFKLLIKEHPNVDYNRYPGDGIGRENLVSRVAEIDRVDWLSPTVGARALRAIRRVVGITHHGSVAEELVFNRIPVVASRASPWGGAYKFGEFWRMPSEYKEILKKIHKISIAGVSEEELSELLSFVWEYRLSGSELKGRRGWARFWEIYNSRAGIYGVEDYKKCEEIASRIGVGSKVMKKFLLNS